MASLVFKRGNRLLAAGSILIIVVAMLHTIGHFAPAPADDTALHAVTAAMRGYQLDMGMGMKPSMMDIYESFSLTMTITVLFLGIQNLVTLTAAGDNSKLVRRITVLSMLWVGGLIILNAIYRVPPPLFSFIVVEIVLVLSLLLNRKQEADSYRRKAADQRSALQLRAE
jgi:hypothetical protein